MTTAAPSLESVGICVYVPYEKFFDALHDTPTYANTAFNAKWDWDFLWECDCFDDALHSSEDACLVLHTTKVLRSVLLGLSFGEDEYALEAARDRIYVAMTLLAWPSDTRLELR